MDLKELIDTYGTTKRTANKLYSDYKNMLVEVEHLRGELQQKLEEIGLKSAKSANFGVSVVSRPNFVIQHEQSVIEWLENTPNIESDAYIGLKVTAFKTLAMEVLKTTGEVIPGTELDHKESIMIRPNKKGK